MNGSEPLRIGILGAARIAPLAITGPARKIAGAAAIAVAARRSEKARAFADEHEIDLALEGYETLIARDDIDLVYIALPPVAHARWAVAALAAGKHVLCEKPFAMNAGEAEGMRRAAERTGRRLIEAMHSRYHPLFAFVEDTLAGGRLGTLQRLEIAIDAPIERRPGELRRDPSLGGGVLMDVGCYALDWCRAFTGEEPAVTSAKADRGADGVDEAVSARLRIGAVEADIRLSMEPDRPRHDRLALIGSEGRMDVDGLIAPQFGNRWVINSQSGTEDGEADKTPSFDFQLKAVRDALVKGSSLPTEGDTPVQTMKTLDEVAVAAGLR